MRKIGKILGILLAVTVCMSAAGCKRKTVTHYPPYDLSVLRIVDTDENGNMRVIRTSENLTFYASDDGLAEFLNDFYARHIRVGDKSIGAAKMGNCWSYGKEWESLALSWFDSTALGLKEYDANALMQKYIDSIDIDKFGNAYVWFNDTDFAADTRAYDMPGQGWVFPDYQELGTYGSEFSQSADGWTVDGKAGEVAQGYLVGSFYGDADVALELCSAATDFSADIAPFVETRLIVEDLSRDAGMLATDIADYSVIWKTAADGEWHEVRQSAFASNPATLTQYNKVRTYFPMYLHPDWKGKITQVGMRVYPKAGKKLDIDVRVEYFRTMADTRQSTSSAKYIMALEEMTSYANDIETLKNNIGRARQALMFHLYALQGKDGLIHLSYLAGHDSGAGQGHRVGNGYYDIYPPCDLNLEANLYFYESLLAMARMEQALIDAGVETETTHVANYDPYGVFDEQNAEKGDLTYDYTPATLLALAETVKTNVRKDCADGGFWNPATRRFAWGIYDANSPGGDEGAPLDYGMTETNIRMVYSGLATKEQAESIYAWLNGTRTVEGDDSTGEDIYFYGFAPRSTTKDNQYDYTSIYNDEAFSVKVQDGGSILYTSYYDVLARSKQFGTEDSYKRLSAISDWYHEVMEAGGEGASFYRTYYDMKQLEDIDNYDYYTLQGGGYDGALGLDNEFYESALIYATVPQAYFGLDANYNTLRLSPNVPSGLDYMAMTNLKFAGHKYDCLITNDQMILSGVTGNTDGLAVRIAFKEPIGAYTVRVNGQESSAYTVENGEVVLRIPFGNVNISVR